MKQEEEFREFIQNRRAEIRNIVVVLGAVDGNVQQIRVFIYGPEGSHLLELAQWPATLDPHQYTTGANVVAEIILDVMGRNPNPFSFYEETRVEGEYHVRFCLK